MINIQTANYSNEVIFHPVLQNAAIDVKTNKVVENTNWVVLADS